MSHFKSVSSVWLACGTAAIALMAAQPVMAQDSEDTTTAATGEEKSIVAVKQKVHRHEPRQPLKRKRTARLQGARLHHLMLRHRKVEAPTRAMQAVQDANPDAAVGIRVDDAKRAVVIGHGGQHADQNPGTALDP